MAEQLNDEIKELNKRIDELEKMLRSVLQPLTDFRQSTSNYLRIISLLLEHGGLTPDVLFKGIKDPISQEIVRVLTKRSDLNISQITEMVRETRGTSSRRIIREKLKDLQEKNIVIKSQIKQRSVYRLSEEVIKKWSQLLGFTK